MFIPLEQFLNPADDRWFYFIPGFNGYEISNDGYVRSMKHYKKYPFGILIQPKKNKDGKVINPEDPTFELSNNNNERVAVKRSQLQYLAATCDYAVTGYPRRTCITDRSSRNQRIFIKKKLKPELENTIRIPKFTIIDKEEDVFEKEYHLPFIECPLESINDNEYYGNKDYLNLRKGE